MKKVFIILSLLLSTVMANANPSTNVNEVLNMIVNYTPPGYYKNAERGYVGLGSLSIRYNSGDLNFQSPVSITMPSIRSGCGGIDIAMGGFAFLNVDYLVKKLQGILAGAPAFAFQLAIETFSPQIGNVMSKLNAVADAINNINFNACNAAKTAAVYIRKATGLEPQDSTVAGNQTASGQKNFWDAMKDSLGITDQLQKLKDAFTELKNTITSITGSEAGSLINGNEILFPSVTGICNNPPGKGYAYSNQKARPPRIPLKYYSDEEYYLKGMLFGDFFLPVMKTTGTSNKDFTIRSVCSSSPGTVDVSHIIKNFESSIRLTAYSPSSLTFCSDLSNLSVNIQGRNIRFNLKDFCFGIHNALDNYAKNIINGTQISSNDAKYLNLVAMASPDVIKLLKISALLGQSTTVIDFYEKDIVPYIITATFIEYLRGVINEGYAEYNSTLSYMLRAIEDIKIHNIKNAGEGKPKIEEATFDAIKEAIKHDKKRVSDLRNSHISEISKYSIGLNQIMEAKLERVRQDLIQKEKALKNQLKRNNWLILYSKVSNLY